MTLQVARVAVTTDPTPHGTLQVSSVKVTATTDLPPVPPAIGTLQVSSVTVTAQSLRAVPSAGADQTAEPWTAVTLTGTASGGTVVSYSWSQAGGTTVALSGLGATRTFTAPATMDGSTLLFGLTVTDADGVTSQADTVVVTVLPATEFIRINGAWVPVQILRRANGTWV